MKFCANRSVIALGFFIAWCAIASIGCDGTSKAITESVVDDDTRLRVDFKPSGSDRPIFVSPDWQRIAVVHHFGDTSEQVSINGVAGPRFPSINSRSVRWSPGGNFCAYTGGTWGSVTLVVNEKQIPGISGFTLAFSPDDAHWAVAVLKAPSAKPQSGAAAPKQQPAYLHADGVERQLPVNAVQALRYAGPGDRLYYKSGDKWFDETDKPAPADLLATLDAPAPTPPPPVVGTPKRPITAEQYIKSVGVKPYKLFVDGKSVGEFDEFLTHNLPRIWQPGEPGRTGSAGKKFYHVQPDGSAIAYGIRGGKIIRLTIK